MLGVRAGLAGERMNVGDDFIGRCVVEFGPAAEHGFEKVQVTCGMHGGARRGAEIIDEDDRMAVTLRRLEQRSRTLRLLLAPADLSTHHEELRVVPEVTFAVDYLHRHFPLALRKDSTDSQ